MLNTKRPSLLAPKKNQGHNQGQNQALNQVLDEAELQPAIVGRMGYARSRLTRFMGQCRWALAVSVVLVYGVASCLNSDLWAQSLDREVLPNGMTILVDTQAANHVVALRLDVSAGSGYEAELLGSGVSAVVQRTLLAGQDTTQLTADLDELTASYRLLSTDRQVATGLLRLAEMVSRPIDWQTTAPIQQAQHLARLQTQLSDWRTLQDTWLRKLLYRRHPARLTPDGIVPLLQRLQPDDVENYYRTRYTAANMTLTVVGNITMQQLLPQVSQAFATVLPGVAAPPPEWSEPRQLEARFKQIYAAVPQRREVLAWRTVALTHSDRLVFDLIAALLANPDVSPLRTALIEGQLVSDIWVEHVAPIGRPGWFAIHYQPLPDRLAEARSSIAQVLQTLTQQGIKQEVLAAARRQVALQWVERRKNYSDLVDYYAHWEIAAESPTFGNEMQAQLGQIDSERVQQVMARWLLANGRNRVALSMLPQSQQPAPIAWEDPAPTHDDVAPLELADMPADVAVVARSQQYDLVECRLVLRGGTAAVAGDFPDQYPGLAQLHAALLQQGSTNRSGPDLRTMLARRAVSFEVEATLHETILRVTCFPDDLAMALAVLVDPLRQPLLNETSLSQARRLVSQQARERSNALVRGAATSGNGVNGGGVWYRLLQQGAAQALPEGHYGAGQQASSDDLAAIDLVAVQAFHERAIQGSNIHLAVYGNVDEAELREVITKQLLIEPTFVIGEPVIIDAPGWNPVGEDSAEDSVDAASLNATSSPIPSPAEASEEQSNQAADQSNGDAPIPDRVRGAKSDVESDVMTKVV